MGVLYATREAVKQAAGINGTSENAAIDRLLESHSRGVERDLGRHFYPKTETRYYDWPSVNQKALELLLDGDLRSITTLAGDAQGTPNTIAAADYFLTPANQGPPYTRIEIDLSGTEGFSSGSTFQRAVSVAGVWGFSADTAAAGATAEALDSSETDVDVTDSSKIGVGDLITIDTESMIVTEKSLLTTTATLSAGIASSDAVVTVPVNDGTKVKSGEVITVDAERMLVEDIAGNNLIVRRAYDGSTLAAHLSAAVVYAPRTLTVVRDSAGSTAAAHNTATSITRNVPPGLITELVIAEVISAREQEKSGYGRILGQGDGTFELRGIGLKQLREQVRKLYARGSGLRLVAI